MPRLTIMDTVQTPNGRTGKVTEFDEVDSHLTAKVRFDTGYPGFEWHKVSDLKRV